MSDLPPPPPHHSTGLQGYFVRDPVRIAFAVYGFVQAIISVLLLAGVVSEVVGGIVTGVALALYGLVNELAVRPASVPRQPLEELAAATRT
jgi:hypothetical protein